MDIELFYKNIGLILLKIKSIDKDFHKTANFDNLIDNARNAKNTIATLLRLSIVYPVIKTMPELKAILGTNFVLTKKEFSEYKHLIIINSMEHGGRRPNAGRKKTIPEGAKRQTLIITAKEREEINKLINKMRGKE